MREKCDEAGLKGILLYVGGNIVVGKQPFDEVEKRFKAWASTVCLDLARRLKLLSQPYMKIWVYNRLKRPKNKEHLHETSIAY